jgi:hypothetical protein
MRLWMPRTDCLPLHLTNRAARTNSASAGTQQAGTNTSSARNDEIMSKRPRLRLPPCIHDIELKFGFYWEPPKLSRKAVARLKAQADRIGRIIADDWIRAARERLAKVGRQIAADNLDQARRDKAEAERLAAERATAETQAIIDRLIDRDLPALRAELDIKRKKRHAMARAVKREKEKLQAAQRKLARAKLSRLGKR